MERDYREGIEDGIELRLKEAQSSISKKELVKRLIPPRSRQREEAGESPRRLGWVPE